MTTGMPQTMNSLEKDLFAAGFDICHPFHPSFYNEHIEKHSLPLVPLSCEETSTAYLIGNTKHLWPIFMKWYNSNINIDSDSDSESDSNTNPTSNSCKISNNPLDTYSQICIDDILKAHFPPSSSSLYQVYWSCESCADRMVSMQRVASCSGLSYLDSKSHLVIHPVYGTWHSFRAVVVIVAENTSTEQTMGAANRGSATGIHSSSIIPCTSPPLTPTPILIPRLSTPMEEREAKAALNRALKLSTCADDDDGENSNRLCEQLHGRGPSEQIAAAWIDVRDCISRGKEYRFDHYQLWYHYTKDAKYLVSGR